MTLMTQSAAEFTVEQPRSGANSSTIVPGGYIRLEQLPTGGSFPQVMVPAEKPGNLHEFTDCIKANRKFINQQLLQHGAILFRGFPVASVEDFGKVTAAVTDDLLEYSERSSPRHQVSNKIYTSTDHPPSQRIFPHNEHSYSVTFPLKLFFCCLVPAEKGGATPIVSIRKVTESISPATRERFRKRSWMYMRNFGDGLGLPWQTTFQTSDRAVVEKYCLDHKIQFEWKDGERLRTRQVRPVFGIHPHTGESLWFNHATFFHVSTLDETMREVLMAEFEDQDLPNNTYYGDGGQIEPEVLDELRAAYEKHTVSFPWQKGDVMLLDNMLAAHARESYAGPRKVVVAMAEPTSRTDI